MTSRERVIRCCQGKGFDRVPIKHEATVEINRELCDYFGLSNDEQLLRVLGDDFRYVEPKYCGPRILKSTDGSLAGYFGERYKWNEVDGGRYLESSYQPFAGVNRVEDLDRSHFPSADWFDYASIRPQALAVREAGYAVCCGSAGDTDFINGIARARGMEQVLIDLIEDNPVYLEIMKARYQFYYEMHERILQAAGGLIDFTHIGEDFGTQLGPMIGMDIFERHFAPKYKEYFQMVHGYGARAMLHMCGAVWLFLPRLIELGLDVYDVVQPTTPENDVVTLGKQFGRNLIFQGSMDVQKEIAFGNPADVEREVNRRLDHFSKGGLILGPSHKIQPNSPLENVLAMYRAAGSLLESIPREIYELSDSDQLPFSAYRGTKIVIPAL